MWKEVKPIKAPEQWRRYKNTDFYVSDQGRVKRRYKNGREYEVGYYHGNHSNPQMAVKTGRHQEIYTKQMVYEAFIGEIPEGYRIIHKNGIKRDNSLWNLKAVSNIQCGKLTGHLSRSQKVYDKNSRKVFRSARAAGKALFCSHQTILDTCNNKVKKPIVDVYWYDEENNRIYRGIYVKAESV